MWSRYKKFKKKNELAMVLNHGAKHHHHMNSLLETYYFCLGSTLIQSVHLTTNIAVWAFLLKKTQTYIYKEHGPLVLHVTLILSVFSGD